MIVHNKNPIPASNKKRKGFPLLGNFPLSAPRMPNLAAKELAFFQYIGRKYRFQRTSENFPFFFLHLSTDPVTLTIEHSFHFKPLFHWTLVNRAAPPFGLSLNCLITPYLTRSLTPSLTRSLTQLLTRSFLHSTSFTFITHLREEKREIKSERLSEISEREGERGIDYTYLSQQSPEVAAERIRADIFNYFSTLDKITSQLSTVSINHLVTQSLIRTFTSSLTRSLTQLLTRSFLHSTSFTFITHLREEKREIKSERVREIREREGERGIEYTYLIRQSPEATAERIRADIFNYFSTLDKINSQLSTVSINHLVIQSLTRTLTSSLTRPLTHLLTRSFIHSTSFTFITHLREEKREIKSERFITQLHEEKREIKSEKVSEISEREGERGIEYTYLSQQSPETVAERIRADIFNYFSTLDKITTQSSAISINHLVTRSLTRALTSSLTRPLTQLLTHSFIRSNSFTFITHLREEKRERKSERFITQLHEEKREIKSEKVREIREREGERGIEYTYLIRQSPEATAERIRADIYNYFSTLDKITTQSSAVSINHLVTQSLIRTLTSSLTRSLTQLLTRSFIRSNSFTFITHLREEKRETKSPGIPGEYKNRPSPYVYFRVERRGEPCVRPAETQDWETTSGTYFIQQSPETIAERIRTDIFNYFSTLDKITTQSSAVSINHLVTQSLTRTLTSSLTRPLTQLLTRSFIRSNSFAFTTHLHEEKREIRSESERERERESIIAQLSTASTSTNRLIAPALTFLTPSAIPSSEQWLTRLLTRSFDRSTAFTFITHLREEKREIRSESERERERESTAAQLFTASTSTNRLIAPALTFLTPSTIPSSAHWLTRLLTRSFDRSTAFTFTTHLHEEKREIRSESERERERESKAARDWGTANYVYLIHQPPDTIPERIRSDIFNTFTTFRQIAARLSATSASTKHLHEGKSQYSFSISKKNTAPSSPQLFMHTTAFVTYLLKGNRENQNIIGPGAAPLSETPVSKLEKEKAAENKTPGPEAPGFEKERLQSRYTYAFLLARTQDAQIIDSHIKGTTIILPAVQWLSSKTGITSETELSPIEKFMQQGREKGINLKSLVVYDYPGAQPLMKHAYSHEKNLTREQIKQIEQTIAAQGKQLENRLKDAIKISPGKTGLAGFPAGQPEVKLSNLAESVHKILLDRIKKERSMRGY